jgi:hypothetical protein
MGALTNKVYAFRARPWELKRTYTHDFLSPMADPIAVDSHVSQVVRILPMVSNRNEQWISDRIRFVHDGLTKQRLTTTLYRPSLSQKFVPVSNTSSLQLLLKQATTIHTIVGRYVDYEQLSSAKHIALSTGSASFATDTPMLTPDLLYQPPIELFNMLLSRNTCFLLIEADLRINYPVLEAKLRMAKEKGQIMVYTVGTVSLGCAQNLGNVSSEIFTGKHKILSLLDDFDYVCVMSRDATQTGIQFFLRMLENTYNITGICTFSLPQTITTIPATFLNYSTFDPMAISPLSSIILYESDAIAYTTETNFIVYMGQHGDVGASIANLVKPVPSIFERPNAYTYTFDGLGVNYVPVQLAQPIVNRKFAGTEYESLFCGEAFPLCNTLDTFIPSKPVQQAYISLRSNAVTRASPSLAIATERFLTIAVARDNF